MCLLLVNPGLSHDMASHGTQVVVARAFGWARSDGSWGSCALAWQITPFAPAFFQTPCTSNDEAEGHLDALCTLLRGTLYFRPALAQEFYVPCANEK